MAARLFAAAGPATRPNEATWAGAGLALAVSGAHGMLQPPRHPRGGSDHLHRQHGHQPAKHT